jgi:uncharacterized protein
MKIEFDPAKNERNFRERDLPFEMAADFDWETAIFTEDTRFPYPERRIVALGFLDDRLHVLCFTPIEGGIRVISFRKANKREKDRYEQEAANR